MEDKPKVIDMFCGCGGLSRGFIDAGYEVILGIDSDEAALQSFSANHGDAKIMNGDLSKESTIQEMKKKINGEKVDLIVGGPPCQGFSLSGTRVEDDERNSLFKSMVKAVSIFKPKAFVLENVPGMATLFQGRAKEAIINEFSDVGYKVESKILYAPDYGVPQIRKRLFFVGLLNGETFDFPDPVLKEENYVTTGEAISDLHDFALGDIGTDVADYKSSPLSDYQKEMRKGSKRLHNHVGTRHTDLVIDVISQVPEGGNHKDLPPGVGESRKFNEAWTRYHREKPSKTIDTGHRNHFHYEYNRVPTVRENARLQSFKDTFIFYGTKTEQYRQVGNAVPPLLGFHLGKQLKKYL